MIAEHEFTRERREHGQPLRGEAFHDARHLVLSGRNADVAVHQITVQRIHRSVVRDGQRRRRSVVGIGELPIDVSEAVGRSNAARFFGKKPLTRG